LKFERPLKDKEIKILNHRLAQFDKRFKGQIKFLIIWTLLALIVGTIAFFKMDTKEDVIILIVTVAIYIGIGVWVVAEQCFKQNNERKSIEYLKSKNLVTAIEVNSDKFYELKEEEDEGAYYLFQLDNNKVFSFGGQDFYPNKKFPNNKFEIVEGRGIKNELLLLETFCYGKKIKPTRIIEGKEKWNLFNNPNYPDPEKLTVANGKIEDYVHTVASGL
jgi:uncharacterized membrane protein